MKYIIGIDNGSQSTKVCIFDLHGNIVAQGRQALRPYQLPKPGYVLHPDDDLWDSIQKASTLAIDNFTGNVDDIVAVGLCTIRCCRAIMKANGDLAYPVLSWMDIRMSQNYDHSIEDAHWVTTSSGYITHRLTGMCKDTAANYVGPWPIDYGKWDWIENEEQFSKYNIARNMLFDLVLPNDKLGNITPKASELTKIPSGIPVFASSNDKAVEALGAGLLRDNTILLSLGTYICSMMQGEEYKNGTKYWANFADLPNKYIYESDGIRRGMWTISWVRDIVFDHGLIKEEQVGGSYEQFLNEEAQKLAPGSDGLLTLHEFLAQPAKPFKKGILIGLDGRHTRAHIYRSVMEGIAMTMKIHADAMVAELDKTPKRVIVSGGGSNSDLFMQIIADVFGIESVRNQVNGCASLGAAINAAIGSEIYENFAIATEQMVREKDSFLPNYENHHLYRRIIDEVYIDLFTENDQLLKKLYAIFK